MDIKAAGHIVYLQNFGKVCDLTKLSVRREMTVIYQIKNSLLLETRISEDCQSSFIRKKSYGYTELLKQMQGFAPKELAVMTVKALKKWKSNKAV